MRSRPAVLLLMLSSVTACHTALQTNTAPAPDQSFAFIAVDSAWFVFPKETDTLLSWNIPGTRQFQGAPERIWMVQLGPYSANEIFELTVRQEWTRDPPAPVASLGEIVRRSSVSAGRAMYQCVCVSPESDPAIRAHVVNQRVQIVVYGKAAIALWLGSLQDTVRFTRLEADTSGLHAVRALSAQKTAVRRLSR
jgi:hypothetical protein